MQQHCCENWHLPAARPGQLVCRPSRRNFRAPDWLPWLSIYILRPGALRNIEDRAWQLEVTDSGHKQGRLSATQPGAALQAASRRLAQHSGLLIGPVPVPRHGSCLVWQILVLRAWVNCVGQGTASVSNRGATV